MKGIILAAGRGTRLYPITKPICKPLLPVYDKPMIYYPLSTLMMAGIRDVLVIVPPGDQQLFEDLLGDGSSIGIRIRFKEQLVPRGIADAFLVGEEFVGNEPVCLALGDNIFFGPSFRRKLKEAVNVQNGAVIFGYYAADPRAFGVVEFDTDGKAISIEEKPSHPKSNYIVPGLYFYDGSAVEIAKQVKPSKRGELEITSVNNAYIEKGAMKVITLGNEFSWFDAGNADNLYNAAGAIRMAQRSGKMIGCIEEEAVRNHWISVSQMRALAESMKNTQYGLYLSGMAEEMDDYE